MVDEVDGRVQTVAGTGSNATSEALSLTKYAYDAGADSALLITPYYNKPQPKGLIEHYGSIAGAVDIPIIAYNVPSRTGTDMNVETIVLFGGSLPSHIGITIGRFACTRHE